MNPTPRSLPRREFLAAIAAGPLAARLFAQDPAKPTAPEPAAPKAPSEPTEPWFRISLAQWSLHKQFKKGEIDPLDFASVSAREFGIRAIEYVNQFYFGRIDAPDYFRRLRQRADDHGVTSLLIMCDSEGLLGAAEESARKTAVENHRKWIDGAATLGCHSIRVNAIGEGDSEEQKKRVADGLHALADLAASRGLDVLVENHGGYSSDGLWVADVIKLANHPRVGTLPDFGNFRRLDGTWADRYEGVAAMMPYAKAVSAKSHEFDDQGNEVRTDYARMLGIVKAAGYRGFIGIEYEGEKHSASDGIKLTKNLLEKLRVAGA